MSQPPAVSPETGRTPWFQTRPRLTIVVAASLFALVLVLRLTDTVVADAVSLLYALPIALVALAFGRTAGLAAGLLGVALVVLWTVVHDVDLTLVGWAARALPLLLLGGLLGDASDRLVAANARARILEATAQRHRDATEVNDTLVQGMAAAKWSFEAGRVEAGLRTLEETLTLGHELVSKLLRDADMGHDGHRGLADRERA